MPSPFGFRRYGRSGIEVSDLFPNMARHVDKMAFIRSCWTESNNHSPALFMINTGMTRMGFPCAGSWATYGLGAASQDLPAFVVMISIGTGNRNGVGLSWSTSALYGHFGIDLTGANGGVVRIDDGVHHAHHRIGGVE